MLFYELLCTESKLLEASLLFPRLLGIGEGVGGGDLGWFVLFSRNDHACLANMEFWMRKLRLTSNRGSVIEVK